ncbi:hypothetical protein EBR21_00980 [bacterium]|nr:hypothetical protein [bacterium]
MQESSFAKRNRLSKSFAFGAVNSILYSGVLLNINGKDVTAVQHAADFKALMTKGSPLLANTLHPGGNGNLC